MNQKAHKWIGSCLLGIVPSILLMVLSNSDIKHVNTFILWVLGTIYLVFIWRFGFWDYFIKKFKSINKFIYKCVIFAMAICLTLVGFFLLPFQIADVRLTNSVNAILEEANTITITSLGQKNDSSNGYDIWIEGISIDDNDYNLYEIKLPEGWDFKEDRPFYSQKKESSIIIPISAKNDFGVMIRRGPSAGKILISINQYSKVIDLYSDELIQRNEIDLADVVSSNLNISVSTVEIILYDIAYLVILVMLSLIVSMWIGAFSLREKKLKSAEVSDDRKN